MKGLTPENSVGISFIILIIAVGFIVTKPPQWKEFLRQSCFKYRCNIVGQIISRFYSFPVTERNFLFYEHYRSKIRESNNRFGFMCDANSSWTFNLERKDFPLFYNKSLFKGAIAEIYGALIVIGDIFFILIMMAAVNWSLNQ